MSSLTTHLKLFKYNTSTDGKQKFNIDSALNNNFDKLDAIYNVMRPIGDPIITLNNTLADDEVWLEGDTVSRTTFSALFAIYGTTYGAGNGSTTFKLPDFRGRAIWGADTFGYIAAGLPNITGRAGNVDSYSSEPTGCFYRHSTETSGKIENTGGAKDPNLYFDASLSNSIYGSSNTVQPPAIKVRVKTRYK